MASAGDSQGAASSAATTGAAGSNPFDVIDLAVNGDAAHQQFGVNGAGITIGIISNAFHSSSANNGSDFPIALADGLVDPNAVDAQDDNTSKSDEGLAMAEIIHEIAPNAHIVFYTADDLNSGNQTVIQEDQALATAVTKLATPVSQGGYGCNIICNDIFNLTQPFYQPGFPSDAAITNAVAGGVSFFQLADNAGTAAFYASQNPSASNNYGFTLSFTLAYNNQTYTAYNFGSTASPIAFEKVVVSQTLQNSSIQWEQPWQSISGSNDTKYGINYLVFQDNNGQVGNLIGWGESDNALDPINFGLRLNAGAYFMAVVLTSTFAVGTGPGNGETPGNPGSVASIPNDEGLWKVIMNTNGGNGVTFQTFAGASDPNASFGSGTVWGDSENPSAITVGAVNYATTAAFTGTNTTLVNEPFSASGPGKYLFTQNGTLIPNNGTTLGKVNISAPDGGPTDVNDAASGGDNFTASDGVGGFEGTSAATPAAAAVGALMLQEDPYLTPTQIASILEQTATPFGQSAGDPLTVTGTGLVNAQAAVQTALARAPTGDMVMRNVNSGVFEIYVIGANAIVTAAQLGAVGNEWQFAGLGGFNGSDTTDVMTRNVNNGDFEIYDVKNISLTGASSLGQVGLNWKTAGFGDFSGTAGETDMMTRDANTGNFEVYDISNNQLTGAALLGNVGSEWKVAGFGDFSGRANETDMLLRDSNNGSFEVYDISGNAVTSASALGNVGLNWTVAGFGDFSSNPNETDMMLRDSNTGNFELYDISNNAVTNATNIGNVGLSWQVAGFGPLDGRGSSDMVLRNAGTGQFEVYDIAQSQLTGAMSMGSIGFTWQVGGFAADPPNTTSSNGVAQVTQSMASFAPTSAENNSPLIPSSAIVSPGSMLTIPQPA